MRWASGNADYTTLGTVCTDALRAPENYTNLTGYSTAFSLRISFVVRGTSSDQLGRLTLSKRSDIFGGKVAFFTMNVVQTLFRKYKTIHTRLM